MNDKNDKKLVMDFFEGEDGELLDVTMPIEHFEYLVEQGVEQNIAFFERILDSIEELRSKKAIEDEKKEVN